MLRTPPHPGGLTGPGRGTDDAAFVFRGPRMATASRSSKRSTPSARKAVAKSPARKAAAPKKVAAPTADPVADTRFLRMARPDALDYRDRWFRPSVGRAPAPPLFPADGLTVKHQ